jgi:hypothetical protein
MFPFWMAFSSLRNFLVIATMRKSSKMRKKMSREYMILRFHTMIFFEPIFPNRMSEGSGAGVITIFVFLPYSSSLSL